MPDQIPRTAPIFRTCVTAYHYILSKVNGAGKKLRRKCSCYSRIQIEAGREEAARQKKWYTLTVTSILGSHNFVCHAITLSINV